MSFTSAVKLITHDTEHFNASMYLDTLDTSLMILLSTISFLQCYYPSTSNISRKIIRCSVAEWSVTTQTCQCMFRILNNCSHIQCVCNVRSIPSNQFIYRRFILFLKHSAYTIALCRALLFLSSAEISTQSLDQMLLLLCVMSNVIPTKRCVV